MVDDEDNEYKDEESESKAESERTQNVNEKHLIFLQMLDEVSDITKLDWNNCWNLPCYEFFNYLSYSRWKNKKIREQLNTNSKTY